MNVLVACEFSGIVRDAFKAEGHNAWSCDLLPTEQEGQHFQADIFQVLDMTAGFWDLMIAFPDCTFLTVAQAKWYYHPDDKHKDYADRRPHPLYPNRREDQHKAIGFVQDLMDADVPRIAIENPVGKISTAIRKPDQTIHPYEHGHDASKRTCLWLQNLPVLVPTGYVPPRIIESGPYKGAKRWANQSPCGAEKTGPSADRWKKRSRTYPGIAKAMVERWGNLPEMEKTK